MNKAFAEILHRSSFGTFVCLPEWQALEDLATKYNCVKAWRYDTDEDNTVYNHPYPNGEGCFTYLLSANDSDLSALKNINIRANWELHLFHTNGETTITPYLNLDVAVACGHFFERYS